MAKGFVAIPRERRYVIAAAKVPAALVRGARLTVDPYALASADITVKDGLIERIDPPGRRTTLPKVKLDDCMVWPGFVDMHTHIDKGHIWPRSATPTGTFADALAEVDLDRTSRWVAEDVATRMEFALRSAYAHGTVLLRTHIDSDPPQHRISWPVVAAMRERWAGRVDLQAVSIFRIDTFLDPGFAEEIVGLVSEHGGILGAFVYPAPGFERAIEDMMIRAAEAGLDLDLHVDESGDPTHRGLRVLADTALRLGFPGTIVAGHCCSLALQPDDEAEETMDRVAQAGIKIVSLPLCNLHLQDRVAGRTPRWRGVTLVHELAARGVEVAIASDNTRDPFYDYGDLDMAEVFREAVRILHLDHPLGDWPAAVARTPAAICGRPERGILEPGGAADLVIFNARDWSELMARPQGDRVVLRDGKAIDRRPPDYRELDHLMERRP
ncbi:MAG: cytosine deaminase [Rhizobiales bacterium]|nr:cytosine deaminase [Hyphomicrobiales bacterium]